METSFFSSKGNRILGSLILVALLIALLSYANYAIKQSEYIHTGPSTFSVSGEGEVVSVPDIGQFSFSVMAKGEDANTAQEESEVKIDDIINFLMEEEVEEEDIKTISYNLYPKYRYDNQVCEPGSYCPPNQIPDGFEVNQTISVKVRNVDDSGELIAGVGNLGATNISGLQFTIDDTDALKEEARTMAIAEARSKAEALADELGVKIKKIVGYHENDNGPGPYFGYGGDERVEMTAAGDGFNKATVPSGENKITSRVTITYQFE